MSSESVEEEINSNYISKNYRHLTKEQMIKCLKNPSLSQQLLSLISKFNDSLLQTIIPLLTSEQIKSVIGRLQLQQTGCALQVMNPEQIRTTLSAITQEDRQLLSENICLLKSCKNKDELQSFVSFIDPLAMAVAIQNERVRDLIIEAAGVITKEQLRVIVPLLDVISIRNIISTLEHEPQIDSAISMIDKHEELLDLLNKDLSDIVEKKESIAEGSEKINEILPELQVCINNLEYTQNKEQEYNLIVRTVKNIKSQIEFFQQRSRELQASLKLPLRIVPKEEKELLSKFQQLSKEVESQAKRLYNQFILLTSDNGLLHSLNKQWEIIQCATEIVVQKGENNGDDDYESSTDSVFLDDNQATLLYEAIKKIGNPEAIGTDHYSMTWNDIINAGFRKSDDFQKKGILSLEDLQKYVDSLNFLTSSE